MESATFNQLELTDRNTDQFGQVKRIKTASAWFCNLFPVNAQIYGAPFLENRITNINGFSTSSPISVNVDFMASILGGDKNENGLVYWSAESQFYYFDDHDNIYHSTTEQKLGDLMRGYFVRCASELQREIDVYHLFNTFRADSIINSVVERAKSILLASDGYFSATSPHQRINGIEQHERLMHVFVEKYLKSEPQGMILMATVYDRFAEIVKEKELVPIKKSVFKDLITPLIRARFGSGLRNDLIIEGRYQRGWKDLALNPDFPRNDVQN
jgi:hypothetical protein